MSRGFHFYQSQPLDRVHPPPPAPTGRSTPFSHKPLGLWNQAPFTLIVSGKIKGWVGGNARSIS